MDDKKFAILIDADNVSAKYIKYILDEISSYGIATYKRIYADWTRAATSSWKDVLLENSITPMQQYNYTVGKNSSDSALIIDAMDILYSNNVDGFCIVSSDSDFTRLATRLRESGMIVIGMGEEKTPKPFVAACNQFKYLDILAKSENTSSINISEHEEAAISVDTDTKSETTKNNSYSKENSKGMTSINTIKNTILKMINDISINDSGVYMGELGSKLTNRYPDFDVRNYGYSKLSKFLGDIDELTVESQKVYLKSDKIKKQTQIHYKKIEIDDNLKQDIIDIIKSYSDENAVDIGYVNQRLLQNHPGYTLKYGFSKIPKFFRSLDFLDVTHNENNSTILSLKEVPKVKNIASNKQYYNDDVIMSIKEILTKAGNKGIHVGSLGEKLSKMYPNFKPKNYGYSKLSTLLNALDFVTLKSKSRTIVYAYIKN
ncbi:MAG: NYN domain-containing protein [Clostridium sp.]|nr:NYN domain-containing protein [Clostridium sp.]